MLSFNAKLSFKEKAKQLALSNLTPWKFSHCS